MALGRDLLMTLKASAPPSGPALSIPVGSPPQAILRPVCTTEGSLNPADVRVLTEWRNRYVKSFLTQFEAVDATTAQWLVNVVGPDEGRILFMVDDPNGQTVGYIGLAFIDWEKSSGEADAVVRGVDSARGLMTPSLRTMLNWARGQLGLKELSVRVRSDNPAVAFFLKTGKEKKRVPLRRSVEENMVRWSEDESLPPGGPSLVYIDFDAKEIHE